MSVKANRIPFPCHPKICWAVTDEGALGAIYRKCPTCGKLYEINTGEGWMEELAPVKQLNGEKQQLAKTRQKLANDRKLLEMIDEVLGQGDDVLIRRLPDGRLKILGQRNFTKSVIKSEV